MRYKKVILYFCCSLNRKEVLLMPSSSLRSIVLYHRTRKQTRSCGCRWLQAAFQSGYFLKPWTLTRMFSARRLQNVNVSFILMSEDLRIYFKSKERLCVLGCVRVRACTVYYKIGNLGNDDGTGAKSSLKIKKQSRCFKLYRSYSISFNLSVFANFCEVEF